MIDNRHVLNENADGERSHSIDNKYLNICSAIQTKQASSYSKWDISFIPLYHLNVCSNQCSLVPWCGSEASSLGPGQQPPLVRARVTQQLTLRPPANTQCLSKQLKMEGLRNRFGFFKRRSNVDRSVVKGLVLIELLTNERKDNTNIVQIPGQEMF